MTIIREINLKDDVIVSLENHPVNRLHEINFKLKAINFISHDILRFNAQIKNIQKDNHEVPSS